jgi:hypothetical protein
MIFQLCYSTRTKQRDGGVSCNGFSYCSRRWPWWSAWPGRPCAAGPEGRATRRADAGDGVHRTAHHRKHVVDRFGALPPWSARSRSSAWALRTSARPAQDPGRDHHPLQPGGFLRRRRGRRGVHPRHGLHPPGSEIKMYIDGVPMYMGPWSHPLLDLCLWTWPRPARMSSRARSQTVGNTFSAINLVPKQHTRRAQHHRGRRGRQLTAPWPRGLSHAGAQRLRTYQLGESFATPTATATTPTAPDSGFANMGHAAQRHLVRPPARVAMDNYADDPGADTPGAVPRAATKPARAWPP